MPATTTKPEKPTPDFPLFAHQSGQWAKKIKGKMKYFGRWDDPAAALANYERLAKPKQKPKAIAIAGRPKANASKLPADSPFYIHRNGQLAKRIKGKTRYFGLPENHAEALSLYHGQRSALERGQPIARPTDALTLRQLFDAFLADCTARVKREELEDRTRREYDDEAQRMIAFWGDSQPVETLTPSDFGNYKTAISENRALTSIGNLVRRSRVMFNWAFKNELIARPVRFGASFEVPTSVNVRRQKKDKPKRLFTAEEILKIIDAAPIHVAPLIWLGVSCGFGNMDASLLRLDHISDDRKWINVVRNKTAVDRRCPLWPEAWTAIEAYIPERPEPKRSSESLFLKPSGLPWKNDKGYTFDVSEAFNKAVDAAGVRREGRSFYALRHTFETIGDETGHYVAVKAIQGHSDDPNDMSATYREGVSDELLQTVSEHVRQWILAARHPSVPLPSTPSGQVGDAASAA